MTMLIPYAGLSPVPWKNGGGSTTQIAVFPPDAGFEDFDWRISLATIAEDGAFSEFPGVERTLALVVPGIGVGGLLQPRVPGDIPHEVIAARNLAVGSDAATKLLSRSVGV